MTSKATKRKYVIQEVLGDFVLPTENQEIVRVISSCGNNLHEVVNGSGEKYLVSMPTKFRRNVWIKRDAYVIVTSIAEGEKVKAEITSILYKEQQKYIKDSNMWPKGFGDAGSTPAAATNAFSAQIDDDMLPPTYSDSEYSDEDGEGLAGAGNPNRQKAPDCPDDSEHSQSDDSDA